MGESAAGRVSRVGSADAELRHRAFLDLVEHAEEQARIDVPGGLALAGRRNTPEATMRCQGGEVMLQAVRVEDRDVARGETLSQTI